MYSDERELLDIFSYTIKSRDLTVNWVTFYSLGTVTISPNSFRRDFN